MADRFDVVVIGAGPGGYIAAIRCAQLGFATACIDDWTRAGGKPAPGGTCTNVGCIPSKALLQSSEHYEHAGHAFADHGIGIQGLTIDVKRMQARKDKVVAQNNDGIVYLFKKNKVAFFHGVGSFAGGSAGSGWKVKVERREAGRAHRDARDRRDGLEAARAARCAFDNVRVLDNAGALAIDRGPGAARGRRRGGDRSRDGQRVAPSRRADDGAGGAADVAGSGGRGGGEGSDAGPSRSRASRSTPVSRSPASRSAQPRSWSITPMRQARRRPRRSTG